MAKENFNFEEVLGKLAACVDSKSYYFMKGPLKELAAHPEQDEVRATLLEALDFFKEHQNPQSTLYLLHEMINDLQKNKSIEASYLQAKLVDKWEEAAKEGAQS